MKKNLSLLVLCLGMATSAFAQTNQPVRPENLSFGASEVAKLTTSGVDAKVITAYVQNSTHPFQLDANDIVYLHDIGASSDLIATMMKHDLERPQPQPVAAAPAPAPVQAAPAVTYTQPVATAPTVVYTAPPVYQTAPVYVSSDYYYPYRSSYYYDSPVSVGIGLGFGFGRVGFGFGHGYYGGGYRSGYGGYHGGGGYHHH